MNRLFVFFFCSLVLGCGSLPGTARTPSNKTESLSEENQWNLLQAARYCEIGSPIAPVFSSDLLKKLFPMTEAIPEFQTEFQKKIFNANQRSFRSFACDQRYKTILADLISQSSIPIYIPDFSWNPIKDSGTYVWKGFQVLKYSSLESQEPNLGTAKNLASKPNFESNTKEDWDQKIEKQIESDSDNLWLIKSNNLTTEILQPLEKAGSSSADITPATPTTTQDTFLFETKSEVKRMPYCVHSISNRMNHLEIDRFWTNCSNAEPNLLPLTIEGQASVLYVDYNLKNADASYQLKLHQIHPLSAEDRNDMSTERQQVRLQKDQVVMNFVVTPPLQNSPADEVPIPIEVRLVPMKDSGFRLAVNLMIQGQNQVLIYDFDTQMKNPVLRTILPIAVTDVIQLRKLTPESLFYERYSGENKKQFNQFSLVTQQIKVLGENRLASSQPVNLVTQLLFYRGKDGMKLPLFVTRKKGAPVLSEENRFGVLSSYGGFNELVNERDSHLSQWSILKAGGFAAFATIRGGGEMGPVGWKKAYGPNRQTSFDDFIAASEFLIRKKLVRPKKLAILGWSNGGLLVLNAAWMRPDLFGAVVAGSPVTDIFQVQTWDGDNGVFWLNSDYGDLQDQKTNDFWKTHSPMQKLGEVQNLPPILLRTAAGDSAVNPFHSLLLYEVLRSRKDADQFFLYCQPDGEGHGPSSLRATIEEAAYMNSFILRQLNVAP